MYPARELTRLAAHKAALQRDIALRRTACGVAAARLAQPVVLLDRALVFWRRLSPLTRLAAGPLALLATRTVFPKVKILGAIARWGPLVVGAVKVVRHALQGRPAPAASANGRR